MSDDLEALLLACKAAPDDDTQRLVLADWLEEHGDEERAWFIRRQCGVELGPDLPAEGELLHRNRARWQGDVPGHWRRGLFVWSGGAGDLPRAVEQATRAGLATWVEGLNPCRVRPGSMGRWLPLLSRLRVGHLDLGGNSIEGAGARALACRPHLMHLRSLSLNGNLIGDAGVRALASSPHLAGLVKLSLEGNNIGYLGAASLAESPHLQGLSSLFLGQNSVGNYGARALAQSPLLARLVFLGLSSNRIGEEGARALAASPHPGRITYLRLWGNAFSEETRSLLQARFGKALHG